jgi:hypothetical protein
MLWKLLFSLFLVLTEYTNQLLVISEKQAPQDNVLTLFLFMEVPGRTPCTHTPKSIPEFQFGHLGDLGLNGRIILKCIIKILYESLALDRVQ